jgi:hypothetical protein
LMSRESNALRYNWDAPTGDEIALPCRHDEGENDGEPEHH